jgi:hypothetical protein
MPESPDRELDAGSDVEPSDNPVNKSLYTLQLQHSHFLIAVEIFAVMLLKRAYDQAFNEARWQLSGASFDPNDPNALRRIDALA